MRACSSWWSVPSGQDDAQVVPPSQLLLFGGVIRSRLPCGGRTAVLPSPSRGLPPAVEDTSRCLFVKLGRRGVAACGATHGLPKAEISGKKVVAEETSRRRNQPATLCVGPTLEPLRS